MMPLHPLQVTNFKMFFNIFINSKIYTIGFNQMQLLSWLKLKLFYPWRVEAPSSCLLSPFDKTIADFASFLIILWDWMFHTHPVQLLPQAWNQSFLQALVLLVRNNISRQ